MKMYLLWIRVKKQPITDCDNNFVTNVLCCKWNHLIIVDIYENQLKETNLRLGKQNEKQRQQQQQQKQWNKTKKWPPPQKKATTNFFGGVYYNCICSQTVFFCCIIFFHLPANFTPKITTCLSKTQQITPFLMDFKKNIFFFIDFNM